MQLAVIEIFVGLVAVAGLIAIVRHMQVTTAKQVVRDISKVYEAMQRVIHNTHADRFLILGLHNGGSKLQMYSRRYITVFEEVHSVEVPAIRGDYKKVPTDGPYVHMMRQLIDEKVISGRVADLQPGLLRDAYMKDNIKYYYIFYITWRNNVHFFGSISTANEVNLESPAQWAEIKICKNKIIQLMTKRRFF